MDAKDNAFVCRESLSFVLLTHFYLLFLLFIRMKDDYLVTMEACDKEGSTPARAKIVGVLY